jgi:HAD superfamily hydrolase (TIGR01509 family)
LTSSYGATAPKPSAKAGSPVSSRVPRKPAAVVLDFDGVILDSEMPEFESHRRIFERCGATLTADDWCGQIGVWTGDSARRWHRRLSGLTADAPTFDQYEVEKRRIFAELLPAEPMPGIRELLELLDRAGVPVAIASSSPARWVVPAAIRLGIASRVRAIVTADDVSRRKPEPDVYLEALRRLGAAAARSVAIEDSAPGVAAAVAAGLWTVAIPHPLTTSHDLDRAHLRVSSAKLLTLELLDQLVGGERPFDGRF